MSDFSINYHYNVPDPKELTAKFNTQSEAEAFLAIIEADSKRTWTECNFIPTEVEEAQQIIKDFKKTQC
jgi:hypothetical protein